MRLVKLDYEIGRWEKRTALLSQVYGAMIFLSTFIEELCETPEKLMCDVSNAQDPNYT